MSRIITKQRASFLFLIILAIASSLSTQALPAGHTESSISGLWELSVTEYGETQTVRVVFQAADKQLTGQGQAFFKLSFSGTVLDDKVEFEARKEDTSIYGNFAATLRKDAIAGIMTLTSDGRRIEWVARRPVSRPPNAPLRHNFAPEKFHTVYSGAIPPALRIFPGDTVATTCLDAFGLDETSVRRSLGGNPLTGPFYIEGALPGDTLIVKFNRVRLNRDWALSGTTVVSNAVTPFYLKNMKPVSGFEGKWVLDRKRGVAMLQNPSENLKNYTVQLQPMIGSVGVAPYHNQSIIAKDSGLHGGNIDYNQIKEGTTLFLPVFQPGALLFIGDGHAAQGDGELTGDALETSLEVEFTVELKKGSSMVNPRAEDADYLMTIGISGDLNFALQLATSEMARWLESEYQLNANEVAMVLGTSMRYDIADLVGHQVAIVAKLKKKELAQLRRTSK